MSLFAIFMLSMLTLLLVLYFVLSPRDTLVELKLVFDWRMIRRGTRIRPSQVQFSIARLLSWMTIIAIYFWLIRGSHFYLRDSIYIGTTFLSIWTCKYIFFDALRQTPRRQYRDEFRPAKDDFAIRTESTNEKAKQAVPPIRTAK